MKCITYGIEAHPGTSPHISPILLRGVKQAQFSWLTHFEAAPETTAGRQAAMWACEAGKRSAQPSIDPVLPVRCRYQGKRGGQRCGQRRMRSSRSGSVTVAKHLEGNN